QTITTIAGNGQQGFSGDNGLATSAAIDRPEKVAVDAAGNVYISDTKNHRVRRVVDASQRISTIFGTGDGSFGGDGRPAQSAAIRAPSQLAFDSDGNLYIADAGNGRIRRVTPAGVIDTVAGSSIASFGGDGGPATMAALA